jgi:hypothetical protein
MPYNKTKQLTLGQLIKKLESYVLYENKIVIFDFPGYFSPNGFISWRGSYNELSIEYSHEPKLLSDLINEAKEALNICFNGYKGGEYFMHKKTPIWVANFGEAGNTGVLDVIDEGYQVILVTSYVNRN